MDETTRAWWTVDLGAVVNVKEVAISQRDNHGELRESLNYISDHVTVGNLAYYLTIYVNAVTYMFCICYKAVSTARVSALAICKSDTCSGNESLAGLQFWGLCQYVYFSHTHNNTDTHTLPTIS